MGKNKFRDLTEALVEDINEGVINDSFEEEKPAIIGFVNGCNKLNVRSKPDIKSDVVCVINEGTKLMIDGSAEINDWYPVVLENGASGFCLKQYIKVI